MNTTADADQRSNVAAFLEVLQQLGWTDGRNVRIDTRWAGGEAPEIRRHAAELVALAPDVILSTGTAGMGPLLQATRTIPIVFCQVADPVGAGFVDSLAEPGGNATGFLQFEYTFIRARPKWRPDRDGERVGRGPSRADHCACRPVQMARSISPASRTLIALTSTPTDGATD
jgi:hypothetical protein